MNTHTSRWGKGYLFLVIIAAVALFPQVLFAAAGLGLATWVVGSLIAWGLSDKNPHGGESKFGPGGRVPGLHLPAHYPRWVVEAYEKAHEGGLGQTAVKSLAVLYPEFGRFITAEVPPPDGWSESGRDFVPTGQTRVCPFT